MAIDFLPTPDTLVRPPHGFGSGDASAWRRHPIGAASSEFDVFGVVGTGAVVYTPTVDCYFRAGAAESLIATSDDFPMLAGWYYKFFHSGQADRFVAVIQKTAAGYLCYYLPGSGS